LEATAAIIAAAGRRAESRGEVVNQPLALTIYC
jgi:hypothetical protein